LFDGPDVGSCRCDESLPYLFLTRGDTPSYETLCTVRVEQAERIEAV
jgi:hypothetical protein